ncbi:MAG: hypothetical protein ACFE88_11885 [Candidatus Hermodarchaeota archaeon]
MFDNFLIAYNDIIFYSLLVDNYYNFVYGRYYYVHHNNKKQEEEERIE